MQMKRRDPRLDVLRIKELFKTVVYFDFLDTVTFKTSSKR